jgi:hypothetical protein
MGQTLRESRKIPNEMLRESALSRWCVLLYNELMGKKAQKATTLANRGFHL